MNEASALALYEGGTIDWGCGTSDGTATDWRAGNSVIPYPDVQQYYHDWWQPYYYPNVHYEKSKIEQAFKIARLLKDKKFLDLNSLKKFIDLVDELVKIL